MGGSRLFIARGCFPTCGEGLGFGGVGVSPTSTGSVSVPRARFLPPPPPGGDDGGGGGTSESIADGPASSFLSTAYKDVRGGGVRGLGIFRAGEDGVRVRL